MSLYARELSKEDIPFIHQVVEENRDILHGNFISLAEWYHCIGEDADPDEIHFILMNDEKPAAWLKLNSLNKPEICISMLVVDKMLQHQGVGKFALRFSEEYAKEKGKTAIRIQTTKDNEIAAQCYQNGGYQIIREMVYQVGDGLDREGYEFRKEISPG